MSNKDRSNKETKNAGGQKQAQNQQNDAVRSTDLKDSPMMAHLMDALEQGQDIGHYGRLTFVMVAHHFLKEEEIEKLLTGQPEMDETAIRALIAQVKERDYNPPKRERILEWMQRQEFPICPDPDDPNACNVYRELQFPDKIYEQINEFWEEKASTQED